MDEGWAGAEGGTGVEGDAELGGDEEAGARQVIAEAIAMVRAARTMPLSASALVARDELLALLEEAHESMPDELRSARWLLKEREEFLARAEREAAAIIEEARVQAEHMVQRTEVVRQARRHAEGILEEAGAKARRMSRETEDYCDRKLAGFEIALGEIGQVVSAARDKLGVKSPVEGRFEQGGETGAGTTAEDAFFDQDSDTGAVPAGVHDAEGSAPGRR